MEVLEFILATWWYACIVMFIGAVAKEKICDGSVTVKELGKSFLIGLGGYFSLLLFLVFLILVMTEEIRDKKLF